MVHRRLVFLYLLNVPSFSSRYFNKIKRSSRLGRLLALSLEIFHMKTQKEKKAKFKKLPFCQNNFMASNFFMQMLKFYIMCIKYQMTKVKALVQVEFLAVALFKH